MPPTAIDPKCVDDIKSAIITTENGLRPCSSGRALAHLTRLSASCQLEDRTEEHWAMLLEDFADDLAEYPEDIIVEGCRAWRRTKIFFPKISEFLEVVGPMLRKRQRDLGRLMVLSRVADHPASDGVVTREWYDRVIGSEIGGDKRRGGVFSPIGRVIEKRIAGQNG